MWVSNPIGARALQDLVFVALAGAFLLLAGWAWRRTQAYTLPRPYPGWFRVWFVSVQLMGGLLPLLAWAWSAWQGLAGAATFWSSYLAVLGLQILCESLTLRQFRSVVWVMVPYLFVPYRLWQLYDGWALLPEAALAMRALVGLNLAVWLGNYLLDLAQLPRLFRWPLQAEAEDPASRQTASS